MDMKSFLAFLVPIVALCGTVVTVAFYFVRNQRKLDRLRDENKSLHDQIGGLRAAVHTHPDHTPTDAYERLRKASTESARAVGAEIHSITVPVPPPPDEPTDLKFILSTDPDSNKILGHTFPITQSLAGWVFQNKKAYIKRATTDPRHYKKIDEVAGTHTGQGPILTLPVLARGQCRGVIQFMKSRGAFDENDVALASRWIPEIYRQLIELEEAPRTDNPSIAHGHTLPATILFSDISAFSRVASRLRLEVTVDLLNEYYSRLLSRVFSHQGELCEYVGDGLYISFLRHSPMASANAAVESAIEMQQEFEDIVRSWLHYEHPVSEVNSHRIGIATGDVFAGKVGHEDNRQEKLVGPAVNFAAHLCQAAKEIGGGILVCEDTARHIAQRGFEVKPVSLSIGHCFQVAIPAATFPTVH